ncbi:MAG: proprotein convertase P-domain-containing protein [Ignavibacteria bacterium]|nr:proprotein convertase P-domain-containing protein [Ignavibacteria bacterium]
MKKFSTFKLLMLILLTGLFADNASAQMFWNNAISFAGNPNSHISRANSSSLNITGSFAIEAWIKPEVPNQIATILQKAEGNDPTGYGIYLFNGRIAIKTNAVTRLISKTVLPVNEWTHFSASYNSLTDLFFIAINATSDTSKAFIGSSPIGNTDSLFIGTGWDNSFQGQLDEIRIWNKTIGSGNISKFMRSSIGANSGLYSGLVLSMTFQDRHSAAGNFSLADQSGSGNTFVNKGAIPVDLSGLPSSTVTFNDAIKLNGSNEYLAAPDNSSISPTAVFTLEAWIYPESAGATNTIIHKGSDNGVVTDYGLRLFNGNLQATVNSQVRLTSSQVIPLNEWTHVAYVYNGTNGKNIFYINGALADSVTGFSGWVNNGNDSLYIGGSIAQNDFDGFIDEVRIKQAIKSQEEIYRFLYQSIDEFNDQAGIEVVYNFDGNSVSSVGTTTRLYFRNNAGFIHPISSGENPISPLNRADNLSFSDGFYIKQSDRRIPETQTYGDMIDDTLEIVNFETINDINVFIALNHSSEYHLDITLISPLGQSIKLFDNNYLVGSTGNLVTILDDQADSNLEDGVFVSFAPAIAPNNNLNSVFSGIPSGGKWRLKIHDYAPGNTGRLYAWGIQINNSTEKSFMMNSFSLIQGFYDPATNLSVRDTMRIYVRNILPPYNIVDSSKRYFQTNGSANYSFENVTAGTPYYLQLKHRNSIETWSSGTVMFDPLTNVCSYDFTSSDAQAFGNNMMQADPSPLRFAIYSGDVNQDGIIDLADGSLIDNSAINFATGYLPADINGDEVVDLSDLVFADNNSFNFVSKITP